MRTQRAIRSVGAAVGIAMLAACAATPTPPAPVADAPISARIDGQGWRANRADAGSVAEVRTLYDGVRLHVRGHEMTRDSAAREVEILVADFAGPGTYVLGAPESGRWALFKRRPRPSLEPVIYMTDEVGGGTVTVTSYDVTSRRVEGSFSFSAHAPGGATVAVAFGRFAGSLAVP